MKTFEAAPRPKRPPGLRPLEDARRLFGNSGDNEIQQRVTENKAALDAEAYGDVGGPSFRSLNELLEVVSDHDPADIAIIREKLLELVANAYSLKDEINTASQQARDEIANFYAKHIDDSDQATIASKIEQMEIRWTPYMQFIRRVGAVNEADRNGQPLKESNFSYPPFAVQTTANGLIYNIIFDADHTYCNWGTVKKLVQYVQQELGAQLSHAS